MNCAEQLTGTSVLVMYCSRRHHRQPRSNSVRWRNSIPDNEIVYISLVWSLIPMYKSRWYHLFVKTQSGERPQVNPFDFGIQRPSSEQRENAANGYNANQDSKKSLCDSTGRPSPL